MNKKMVLSFTMAANVVLCYGQKAATYNLAEMLRNDQLVADTSNHAVVLKDQNHKGAISLQRVIWLKNLNFSDGTIDVDLRGKMFFCKVSWVLHSMLRMKAIMSWFIFGLSTSGIRIQPEEDGPYNTAPCPDLTMISSERNIHSFTKIRLHLPQKPKIGSMRQSLSSKTRLLFLSIIRLRLPSRSESWVTRAME